MKDFIEKYLKFALMSEKKTGIKAVFTLAQGAFESGWGKKAPKNNFFGVKAGKNTPLNKKQLFRTREYLTHKNGKFPFIHKVTKISDTKYLYIIDDWFMAYDSPEESFTEHSEFFFKNKRYAKALLVKDDPYKFADEIAKAGYATDTTYATTLKKIIKQIEVYISKMK